GNMAQLEELRPRIKRLRLAGKPVVAYLENGGGRGDLYLAAACNRIVTTEEADFMALGLRSERRYWRGALARAGIRVDRSSTGAFKSAYRNFSTDSMPTADSVATQHELDVRQKLFVDAVSSDRGITPARLATYLDGREWDPAALAAGGVVDSIGYREDAMRILGRLAKLGERPRAVNLARTPPARREWTRPHRIAIVYAGGGIDVGRSGNDLLSGPTLGSATLIAELERAFHARDVRAVVLRIESPGGSALAANLIDHAVQRLKRETRKPLIVSMGSVAGSGGYYIACHADWIVADRNTRTASIGVLTIRPSFEGLYEKLGAHEVEFDRGDYMRGTSWSRDWGPREQATADSTIQRLYRGFVGKVADGRHLDLASVEASAQGRVWMGDDALARKLVDEIGGLDDAMREARLRGGIRLDERIRPLELGRPRPSFVERLLGGWVSDALARDAQLPDWSGAQMLDPDVLDPLVE
ncbi:MAG TPA: S49 family peptidase, partial [Candidatus Acidoferrales bacterium]|nr:S49 family peptidase [Candidatus Acidoferrales bacterium]